LDRIRAWCKAYGYTIMAECQDVDASGADDESERPGLAQALDLACHHKAALCVYSLSRLSRDTEHALRFQRRLRKAGASLASLNERLDTSTAAGRFTFAILAAASSYERELTAERVSDGMRRRQASGQRMSAAIGRPFGGKPASCLPYGWMVDPADAGRLVECAEEMRARARAKEMRAIGLGLRQIARQLTLEGHPCRGQAWHHQMIAKLVK
jgi:DNA invertase Pin-like site-specific DNA recombinase